MEKYFQIIILSKEYTSSNKDILVIKDNITLEDDMHLIYNNELYTFDYLIFTDTSSINNFRKTNILHEDGIPITNCYYQTTYENIYYPINNKIDEALDNIYESNL